MKPTHESMTYPCGLHAEFRCPAGSIHVRIDRQLLPGCIYGEPTVSVNVGATGCMTADHALAMADVIRAAVQWGEEALFMRVMPAYQAHLAGDNSARCLALGIELQSEV